MITELKISKNDVDNFFNNTLSKGMLKTTTDIKGLTNAYGVAKKSVISYVNGLKEGSIQLENGTTYLQGYQAYLKTLPAGFNAAAIGAKALSVAMQVISSIGWMALITGITTLISKGIGKFTEFANETDNLAQKANGFANSTNSAIKDMAGNSSTLSELNAEYQELSKHVNALGENVDLSADQYTRYKEIVNQVSDIMPDLNTYFNAQGEKIGFAKGQLADFNDEYKDYIQQQAQKILTSGDENGNTFQDALDNFEKNNAGSKNWGERIKSNWSHLWGNYDINDLPVETMLESFEQIQNKSAEEMAHYLGDINISDAPQSDEDLAKEIIQKLLGASSHEISEMDGEDINELQRQISGYIQELQYDKNVDMSPITSGLIQSAYANDDFWALAGDDLRNNVTTMLSSIPSDVWSQLDIKTDHNANVFVAKIIDMISQDKDGFAAAWNGLFDLDASAMPVSDYISQIQANMDTIAAALGLDEEGKRQFMISLGFDFDTNQAMADGLKERLTGSSTGATAGVNRTTSQMLYNQQDDTAVKWVDSLNQDDLQIANSDEFADELERQKETLDGAALSAEDYANALQQVKDNQANQDSDNKIDSNTTSVPLSISETVDQLNTQLKPSFDALKNAYQSIFSSEDGTIQFSLEGVDLSTFDTIKSAIDELNNIEGINVNYDVFDNYVKVLSNTASTEAQVQEQFDNLASSILYASDCTNMSSESFDLLVKSLSEMGVTNAEEVLINVRNAQNELADAGYNVRTSTDEEAASFIESAGASEFACEYLRMFEIQKYLASNPLNTYSDITALEDLCNSLGVTGELLKWVASLKGAMKAVEAGAPIQAFQSQIDTANKNIQSITNGGGTYKLNLGNKKTAPSSTKSGSGASAQQKKVTKQTFNFIETAIKRISSAIDKLKRKVNDTGLSFNGRMEANKEALTKVTEEIGVQQNALDQYMARANAVGLEADYVAKIQNGSLSIEDITDDGLKQRIQDYQTWYEKALDCQEKIDELTQSQKEMTQADLDMLITQYDKLASKASSANNRINNSISLKETLGFSASAGNYASLNKNNQTQISYLNKQNDALKDQQKTVEKNSEKWYEYQATIDSNNESIQNLTKSIAENAIAAANLSRQNTDKKNDKLDAKNELLDAKSDNTSSSYQKNRNINLKKKNNAKKITNLGNTIEKDQKNLFTAKHAISGFKKTKDNKQLLKEIKDYIKKHPNKKISALLLTKASKLNDNGLLFEACSNYNASIDQLSADTHDYDLLKEINRKEEKDAIPSKIENIKGEYDTKKLKAGNYQDKKTLFSDEMKKVNGVAKSYNKKVTTDLSNISNSVASIKGIKKNKANKKILESIKNHIKKNPQKPIPDKLLNRAKKLIDWRLYNYCIEYNNNLAQYFSDKELADLAEDAAKQTNNELAAELFQAGQQEYTNQLNTTKSKNEITSAKQNLKTTKGIALTSADYQDLISGSKSEQKIYEDGKKELDSIIQSNLKKKYWTKDSQEYLDALQAVSDYEKEIENCKITQEEYNNAMAELPYAVLEKAIALLDAIANYNKSKSALITAQGKDLSKSDYITQMEDNNKKIAKLESEGIQAYNDYLKALSNSDGVYGGKTADEWFAKYKQFCADVNNLKAENEDLKRSLRDDVYWRTFERAHDAVQRYKNIISGITDLIDDNMLFDSDGKFTEYGVSKIAGLVSQYEAARKEVENYSNDIKNLNDLYQQGEYTQAEYLNKLNELQTGLLGSASSMKSYMSEISGMYKNQAKSELDALFELIDARNEALTAKKEYYDYDKTIKSKTKDIQSLQAQIAALENIETAEAKAKNAKLKAQLSEAQNDFDDTINEHMLTLSTQALDSLKETLQDTFDEKWEHISSDLEEIANLMSTANNLSSAQSYTINSALNKLLNHYGINPASIGAENYAGYAGISGYVSIAGTNELSKYGQAILTPIIQCDSAVSNSLSGSMYGWESSSAIPHAVSTKDSATTVIHHFDNLLNVEGNVDSTVITDVKGFASQFYHDAYEYTVAQITKDARKMGIKV